MSELDELNAERETADHWRELAEQRQNRIYELAAEVNRVKDENNVLHSQVKVLQSDANSWQSGYDEGRSMGAKHMVSEVARLKAENETLRKECKRLADDNLALLENPGDAI